MRIIIALGNEQDTGGPTKYAQQLRVRFEERGHRVVFVTYSASWWRVPSGLRHLLYAAKLWRHALRADVILGFDTLTVGAPALLAGKCSGTPLVIRIGGDFMWEQYVERTGELVKLSEFYTKARPRWSYKDRLIFWLTRLVVRHAGALLFNSNWQKDLWQKVYGFDASHAHILENLYPPRKPNHPSEGRVFVSAGRPIKLKQEDLLRRIFARVKEKYPDVELDTKALPAQEHAERVARSYAIVLPSVSDVSPNAIIDAVAAGKPFVATSDTGIRERLEGTGLFVDTQDEHALEDALESLLDSAEYARVSARVQNFSFVRSWDDIAEDVLAIMKKVCAS